MKKFLKFMTAVVAVGALSSCADELIDNQKQALKDGDLVGYLQSPTEDLTRVAFDPNYVNENGSRGGYVWSDDDAIRVYTLDKLLYSQYSLIGGQGTQEGIFSDPTQADLGDGKKYAVTEPEGSKTIYGISAEGSDALLTATMLPRYDWDDVVTMDDGSEIEAYRLPTPFWGDVTKMDGSNINVNFQALTSFIKLDLRRVPQGTQAIVLVSHEDYYTVAEKGTAGAVLHAGGANEPLAGTMNAILKAGAALKADTRLAASDTLRIDFDKVEEIAGEDKIIYIPVVAQRYDKLDLLAVKTDNRAPYTWTEAEVIASWTDEEFKVGKTKGVYVDAAYEIPATVTSPRAISNIIAGRYDGSHDVRVKVLGAITAADGDNELFIVNNAADNGLEYSNVEITFAQQPAGTSPLTIVECPATYVVNSSGQATFFGFDEASVYKASATASKSDVAIQTVKLNFEAGGAENKDLSIVCPQSDVVLNNKGADFLGTITVTAANTNELSGYESSPKNMKKAGLVIKGGLREAVDSTMFWKYNKIIVRDLSEKTGVYAYEQNTRIKHLELQAEEPGSVRLTDALVDLIKFSALDLSGTPTIITTGSAAMKELKGDQNKVKVHAFWTGKSLTDYAVATRFEGAQVKDDQIPSGAIYTAAQLQAMGLDKGIEVGEAKSVWTSENGVYVYTVSKKVGFIWLGGEEFPWIGPQMGKMQKDITIDGIPYTNRQLIAPATPNTQYDPYNPCEYAEAVSVDFNWVEMRNMELTINDPYFIDPHKCCTSCGDFVVKVERDLGLIRSINTTSTATVKNLRLNDVELICDNPKVNIPNVGSAVGRITADMGVTMDDNRVTNLEIAISGGNAGGHVGLIQVESGIEMGVVINNAVSGKYDYSLKNTALIDPDEEELSGDEFYQNMINYAESGVYTNFVSTIGDNAGGIAGKIVAPYAKVHIKDAKVGMFLVSAEGSNNVGGMVGDLAFGAGQLTGVAPAEGNAAQIQTATASAGATLLRGNVTIDNIIATFNPKKTITATKWGSTGDNVGGFAGRSRAVTKTDAQKDFAVVDATTALDLVADGNMNATLVYAGGRYAGGLLGYNKQPEATANSHSAGTFISSVTNEKKDTKVNIATLTAENSCAGGLVGQQVMGDLVIGGGATAKDADVAKVEVAIGKLSTAFAGGGLVGQNLDDVDINTKYRTDETSNKVGYIKANVTAWENTWDEADFTEGIAGESTGTLRMFCGSFDNLAGLVSEHFKVKNVKATYDNNGNLTGGIETKGLIPDATKKALFFQLHSDPNNTNLIDTDPYWGDQLGYVGYADQSSFYLLDGSDSRQGDQQFNYRKPY